MTYQDLVLRDLENGRRVTNHDAFNGHSMTRLGGTIFKLRGKGFKIQTVRVTPESGKFYARYVLS